MAVTEDSTRMKSDDRAGSHGEDCRSMAMSMSGLDDLRLGAVTALDAVTACLYALRQVDAETNAVAAFEDERAREDAARLDEAFAATGPVGPLHGLPITV